MSDNGGPAFPFEQTVTRPVPAGPDGWFKGEDVKEQSHGMTLRDYFIAHAPVNPWPIFQPVMPPKPKPGIWISDDGKRKYADYTAAEKECGDACYLSNQDELRAWDAEREFQYYAQWPGYWADAMLNERAKHGQ